MPPCREDAAFAPETEPDEPEASVPEQVLPEPQEDVPGGDEESEAEPEAPENVPEQDNAGEQPAVPEDAASPEEPETQAADVNAAPEAEAGPVDEPAPGQVPPEARPEPLDEAAAEAEEAGSEASGPRFETVDIGLGTIEVYSDSEPEPETPDDAAEPVPDEPEADADEDVVAAPEEEYAGPEEEPLDDPGPDGGYVPEPEYDYPDYPEPEPEKPKMRGGRVFLSVLLGIIVGIPVAAVLIVFSLALLALGAALIYVGGVFISFAFLGMSVVADILLTVGFGLFVAAIGLPVVFLAVWFFLRCVVGLYSRLFAGPARGAVGRCVSNEKSLEYSPHDYGAGPGAGRDNVRAGADNGRRPGAHSGHRLCPLRPRQGDSGRAGRLARLPGNIRIIK